MTHKKISDLERFIASLTKEEKVTYRDIIEECLDRDRKITQDFEQAKKSMQQLVKEEKRIISALKQLNSASHRILGHTSKAYLQRLNKNKMGRS